MSFEKPSTIKREGKNREKLLELEKEGKYVFHGSPEDIDVLEPRQAYNQNEKTGKMEKDGKPALFATPYADIAIFRALTDTKGVSGESLSYFGIDGDELYFSMTKNLLRAAQKKNGRVYVLDKENFQDFKGAQCRSLKANKAIKVIKVIADDLPPNINITK